VQAPVAAWRRTVALESLYFIGVLFCTVLLLYAAARGTILFAHPLGVAGNPAPDIGRRNRDSLGGGRRLSRETVARDRATRYTIHGES
jgi:hypothetical protein